MVLGFPNPYIPCSVVAQFMCVCVCRHMYSYSKEAERSDVKCHVLWVQNMA